MSLRAYPRLELASLIKDGDGFLRGVVYKGFNNLEEAERRWQERLANQPGLRAKFEAQQNGNNANNAVPPSHRAHNRVNNNSVPSSARSQNIPSRTGNGSSNLHGVRNNSRDLRNHHSYPSPSPSAASQSSPNRSAARGIQRAHTSPADSAPRATLDTTFSGASRVSSRTQSLASQTNYREPMRRRIEDAPPSTPSRGSHRSHRHQGSVNNGRGSNHQLRPRASIESSFSDESAITISSSEPESSSESDRSISMVSHQRTNSSRAKPIRRPPPPQAASEQRQRASRHGSVAANSEAGGSPSPPRTPSARKSSSVSSRDTPPSVSSPSRGSVRSSKRKNTLERLQEQPIVGSAPGIPRGSASNSLRSSPAAVSRAVQTARHAEPHDCHCRHGVCRHECNTCLQPAKRSSALFAIGFSDPPPMPSFVVRDPRSPVASGSTLIPAQVGR